MISSDLIWLLDSLRTWVSWPYLIPAATALLSSYMALVRTLRYRRMEAIKAPFVRGKRPLSSMTVKEAHDIIAQLQELEFPSAFGKARRIALLKVGVDSYLLAVLSVYLS